MRATVIAQYETGRVDLARLQEADEGIDAFCAALLVSASPGAYDKSIAAARELQQLYESIRATWAQDHQSLNVIEVIISVPTNHVHFHTHTLSSQFPQLMQRQQDLCVAFAEESTAIDSDRVVAAQKEHQQKSSSSSQLPSLAGAESRELVHHTAVSFRAAQRVLMLLACFYLWDDIDMVAIHEDIVVGQCARLLLLLSEGM